MKLFFHHVGQRGADEDFKKTVYTDVDLQEVRASLPSSYSSQVELLQRLQEAFPTGAFNCWGVPAGAKSVIRQLTAGDYVLLVHSATEYGQVPVLCNVRVFWPHELRDLSFRLWENDKYPYIFFFDTEELTLSWPEFREHLGYSHRYDPRGTFCSVRSERLDDFGGVQAYVESLRSSYKVLDSLWAPITNEELHQLPYSGNLDESEVNNAPTVGEEELEQTPNLTESVKASRQVSLTPRDAKFRIVVRRAYNARCAVCEARLTSPNGEPEVESAHIYPKRLKGKDDLRNGLCLCRSHHWALDVGWMAVSDNHKVLVRDGLPEQDEYDFIRMYEGTEILLPANIQAAPHPVFLSAHRKLVGFE